MAPLNSRRKFILQSSKAGFGLYLGSSLLSSYKNIDKPGSPIGFQQDPLPYSYSSLNDAIDATTMEIHYTKHAAAYATNLQAAAKKEGIDTSRPVEDVLRNVSKYSGAVRNNGGGHYNHELFWKSMAPNASGMPTGKLADAINSSFGSFETFKTQFSDSAKGRFGSGWAWLFLDNDKKLRIGSTPNQDNPLMDISEIKGFPVLGLDVWEHAYYLRYQNRRPEYIANWWKVVNWNFIQDRYQSALV
ncbi:MAG TPA: superoxide dismutase [Flavisolibacter sp.]|nr:superoxide dismutase [Flavisolibacter sp.]